MTDHCTPCPMCGAVQVDVTADMVDPGLMLDWITVTRKLTDADPLRHPHHPPQTQTPTNTRYTHTHGRHHNLPNLRNPHESRTQRNPMVPTMPPTKRLTGRPWRRLKTSVLAHTTICHICGHDGSDTADHIIPIEKGGTNHPTNLKPAHHDNPCPTCGHKCNREKSNKHHAPIIRNSNTLNL